MIEDKIEIIIPTYNRADYLNNTLNYLLNSPFKNCKITIRDNASEDNTQEICEKYSKLFKNINIIKNNKNIGIGANVWACYEQATYPYVWVLGDNDYLNFDKCDDFINAIESEKYDLIICNSSFYTSDIIKTSLSKDENDESISQYIKRQKPNDPNYLENSTQELALIIKEQYLMITSFMSSTIYKTSLIDSEVLISGSHYISRKYPHFPLIAKTLNNNCSTYKTEYDIVFAQENPNYELTDLELYAMFLDCIPLIDNKQIRSYSEGFCGNKTYYDVAAKIIYAKADQDPDLKIFVINLIKTMFLLRGWFKGCLYQIYIMIIYFLVPTAFCKYFVKKRR